MPAKVFVRLHLPPPVTATLARGFLPDSNKSTSASGLLRLSSMAQKQPAAPAPMMATFIFSDSFLESQYNDNFVYLCKIIHNGRFRGKKARVFHQMPHDGGVIRAFQQVGWPEADAQALRLGDHIHPDIPFLHSRDRIR